MMSTFFKRLPVFVFLALVALVSCKKDDEKDRTALLVDKNWRLTAAVIDPALPLPNGTRITNLYAQLDACDRDDITIYLKNGTVNFDEGPTKCNPNAPQTTSGTWAFNTDKTILSVTQSGVTTSYTIKELTSKQLIVDYVERISGINYTITATFTN